MLKKKHPPNSEPKNGFSENIEKHLQHTRLKEESDRKITETIENVIKRTDKRSKYIKDLISMKSEYKEFPNILWFSQSLSVVLLSELIAASNYSNGPIDSDISSNITSVLLLFHEMTLSKDVVVEMIDAEIHQHLLSLMFNFNHEYSENIFNAALAVVFGLSNSKVENMNQLMADTDLIQLLNIAAFKSNTNSQKLSMMIIKNLLENEDCRLILLKNAKYYVLLAQILAKMIELGCSLSGTTLDKEVAYSYNYLEAKHKQIVLSLCSDFIYDVNLTVNSSLIKTIVNDLLNLRN